MKHRKLFLADNLTNITLPPTPNCIYCFPGCPFNITCEPFVFDLPTPPPPPPPPPPPSPPPAPSHHVSPYVVIIVCSVLGFFFFIIASILRSKLLKDNQASRNNGPQQSLSDDLDEEVIDENRVDHPIWLISTVGLQQSIINSIAVCKYKKGEGLVEGTECSVCLNEFLEDETLRLLPKCNHAFHVSCIDTWLKSHTNCPMCRASIVSSIVPAPLPLSNQNLASSIGVANPQIDNSRQLCENQEGNSENRTGTIVGKVLRTGVDGISTHSVNSNENGVLQVHDDSGDGIHILEDDSQPFTRSVSFSSSALTETMTLGLDDFDFVESGKYIPVDQVNDGENSHSTIDNKQDGENPSTSR